MKHFRIYPLTTESLVFQEKKKKMNYRGHLILFVFWTFCIFLCLSDKYDEEQYGVKYADDCEVCKIVSNSNALKK